LVLFDFLPLRRLVLPPFPPFGGKRPGPGCDGRGVWIIPRFFLFQSRWASLILGGSSPPFPPPNLGCVPGRVIGVRGFGGFFGRVGCVCCVDIYYSIPQDKNTISLGWSGMLFTCPIIVRILLRICLP